MMKNNTESTVSRLREIIDQDGPLCLSNKPYEVYEKLLNSGDTDRKTAAALLLFLVSGLQKDAGCWDAEFLSKVIRTECCLNKKMSDRLALILTSLYSADNLKEWQFRTRAGLKQFLKEVFICKWNGFAVWDAGSGTIDCHYEAEIALKPTEVINKDEELTCHLKQNPFMTKEAIQKLFMERLRMHLDREFDSYCTCDDYYQPLVEDYGSNLDYNLDKWCRENGFEIISVTGAGSDDGYDPKPRQGWY